MLATLTWVGDVDLAWNTNSAGNTNWNTNTLPASGDTLIFAGATPGTLNNNTAAGNSYILQLTAGGYTLSGNAISLNLAGTDISSTTGTNTISLPVTLDPNTVVNVAAGTLTISGATSGAGALNKSGAGTLVLAGAGTYTGATTVSAGTLRLSGPLVVPAVPAGAAGIYTYDTVAGTTVTNGGTLGAAENGTLVAGATVVAGGQIGNAMDTNAQAGSRMEIGPTAPLGISLSGGSWTSAAWFNGIYPSTDWRTLFRSAANDHQIIIENGTDRLGMYDNTTGGAFRPGGSNLPTSVTGWHHIAAVGSGNTTTLFLDGVQVGVADRKGATDIFSVGAYQGGSQRFAQLIDEVYIYQSALSPAQIGQLYNNGAGIGVPTSANSIPDGSVVTIAAGATLDMNSVSESVGALAGAGTVTTGTVGASTLTVGGGDTSGTFSGIIQNGAGTLGLTKVGTGIQTLSGSNTYSDATTVSAGTLRTVPAIAQVPINLSNVAGGLNIADPAHIKASTFYAPDNRAPHHASNWTGMTGTFPNGTAGNAPGNNMWLSNGTTGAGTWIAWDLGSSYTIGSAHVWNYNEINAPYNFRGVRNFTLQVAATAPPEFGGAGVWTDVQAVDWSNTALYQATGLTTYAGFDFNWAAPFTSRYVRFNNTQNYGPPGDAYTGLSEVVFNAQGTANVIPDASTVTVAAGAIVDLGSSETVGALSGAGTVTSSVAGASTFTVGASNAGGAFSGVIQNGTGTVTLNKIGTGTQAITGTNTYGGPTNILGGVLSTGANGIPNTSAVFMEYATGLVLTGSDTIGSLTGVGNVVLGAFTLTTGGNNTSTSYGGVISGTGGVTKVGTGAFTLFAANTYTGATTVNAGVLNVGGTTTLPVIPGLYEWFDGADASTFTIAGGTISQWRDKSGGNRHLNQATAANQPALVGTAVNGNSLVRFDGNDVIFNAAANNPNVPYTMLTAARLDGSQNQRLITSTGNNWLLGYWGGNSDQLYADGTVRLGGGPTPDSNMHFYGAQGTGAISTVVDGGRFVAQNNGGLTSPAGISLGAWNGNPASEASRGDVAEVLVYTGVLTTAQAVSVYEYLHTKWSTNVLADTSAVTVAAGATVNVNVSDTIGNLAGAGTINLNKPLTVNQTGATTFSGILAGAQPVTKGGAGTLTLSGANTYTGTTTITQGMLTAANASALGTAAGNTVVYNGASLGLSGGVTIATEAISASGGGVGGAGAIRNVSGNNTLGGVITMNGTSSTSAFTNVAMQQPTAKFSQTGFSPVTMLDGDLSVTAGGWANDPNSGGNEAVFETTADLNPGGVPTELDFLIYSGGHPNHTVGRFKLFATTDNRANFADGLINGGDITANWVELTPIQGSTLAGSTLTILPDNSIRASGTLPNTDVYIVRLSTSLANITGFKIEAMEDPSFAALGPGRATNGNFVLKEWGVSTAPLNRADISLGSDAGLLTLNANVNNAFASGIVSLVGAGNVTIAATSGIVQTGGATSVFKTGTGTATNVGANNNFAGLLTVNGGIYGAGHASAVGTAAAGTQVGNTATVSLSGGITIAGETFTLSGLGAAGTGGSLSNLSGNNTLTATSVVQAGPVATQFSIGSIAGDLTVNAAVNMGYAQLVSGGAGNIILNGVLSSTILNNPTLSNLNTLAAGNHTFNVAGETISARVDNDGTNRWLLIGRGRQGWEFDADGQGTAVSVNQGLGTPLAFFPAAYSNAVVNDMLAQSGLTMGQVEVRIKRAENAAGSAYQENRWQNWQTAAWTWVLSNPGIDVQSGGIAVTRQIVSGAGSPSTQAVNTMDALPPSGNGPDRIFTWGWNGHSGYRGFTYGSTVNSGANDLTSFLYEINNEDHAIPYTEVYIRMVNAAPPTQNNSVVKNGTGTLTLAGANTYAGTTTVNAGVLNAANNTALGTTAAATTVFNGGTLALSGGITLAGEALTLAGLGAAGQPGALVNLSGTNTVAATSPIVALTAYPNRLGIGATAGTLNVQAPINMQLSRLVVDGAGAVNITGVVSATAPTSPTLATLNHFGLGDFTFNAAGQSFTGKVQSDGTNSWLVIGRGRQGWEFDNNGQGAVTDVSQFLGTTAAFTPAAYSDAIVNDLLAQLGINNTNAEFRIRRATDVAGVNPYQETRWFNFATPNFTFDFDGGSGIPMSGQVFASSLNAATAVVATNTRDMNSGATDATRVFTWDWAGHNLQRGFAYGSTVQGTDNNSATSFIWEFTTEGHAIPYSEFAIRGSEQITADNGIIKNGTGTLTLSAANTYSGPTEINGGTLVAANNAALGTIGVGTTVFAGGTLGLSGNVTIATEALTVHGVAGNTQDAIANISGTNSYSGPITFVPFTAAASTTIGSFTGGDVGQGLDLTGTFAAAVNVGGPAVGPVQGVSFTSTEAPGTPGLTFVAPTLLPTWHAPYYGTSANDNNLEVVMQSIRYNPGPPAPATTSLALTGLTPGNVYKVQMLFAETCCMRGFDVFVEGVEVAPDFAPFTTQGGINNLRAGAVITRQFQAGDAILNIALVAPGAFADPNPIISGFTLENLGPIKRDLNIRSDAGLLTLTSGLGLDGSVLTLKGAGNLALPGNITQVGASSLVKNDAGVVTLGGTNTYSGTTAVNAGTLALQNGNAILNTAGAVTAALGGTLQLLTSETISSFNGAGDLVGTNDSTLALGNNVLTATGAVAIANVTVGTAAGIVAGTSITDTDDDNNITGTSLFLQAPTGIGTLANPIETTLASLEASGGTGGVFIANTGNLTVGGVSALVGLTASASDIVVSTAGSLTITENVTATGAGADVSLSTVDAAAAGQNLVVNAGVTASATATVTISSGDDATITGNVTSGTTTTINVDAGNLDPATGAALVITGIVTTPVVGSGGGAFLNGQTDNDTFTFVPQTTTEFRVNGNLPVSVAVGDTLVLNVSATTSPSLSIPGTIAPYTGPGSGAWSFTSVHRPVLFASIEASTITGNYHLTYNNSVTPVGNLVVMRDATQAILQLRDGTNAGPVVFQGSLATILSLTVLGSAGNDTVTVDDINTLPNFSSTVPGVSNNANVAGTAEFLFDGLGGTDTLAFAIAGANASQTYGIGNGTGAAGLQGEIDSVAAGISLLSYFQNVENMVRTGAGATPGGLTVIGDGSANAFSVQGNMTVTRVSAPGYTPLDFSGNNYSALTINALAGTDTVDLVSFGTAQTNNPAINFDGGTQDDVLRVRTTNGNTGVVTLSGGLGNDTFNLFDTAPTVDGIVGPVIVDGGDGNVAGNTDTLVIDDRADLTADTVIIGAVNPLTSADYRVEGITTATGNDVVFRNIDTLTYTATSGNDILDTQLTNTVPQHDLTAVTVNGWLGGDQFLLFTSDQAGGTAPTPTGTASGVATVNLNGDAPGNPNGLDGNDVFGQTAPGIVGNGSGNVGLFVADTVRGLRPSVSTAITINGGQPTGPASPTGDTVGDVINVDVSGLPGSAALVLPTVSGILAATGFSPLSYAQIEDFNLIVNNHLVNVQMGDTFVRGTAGPDLIQFMRNPIPGDSNHVRVRVNTLIVDFTLTGKTVTFAGGSNDYVTQSNVTNPAEVYGEGGDDYISGAMGNDYLVGGLGSDQINASGGDNIVWGDNAPTIPTDPTPQDLVIGGDDVLSGLGGNDVFYGGGGNDTVSAGGGNDYAYGGQGDDTLGGAGGDDRLFGGLGNDVVSGHAGNDLISGGGGDDQLEGNTGNDVLLAGTGADLVGGGDGSDLIVSGSVTNEASIWTSLPNTTTFNSATYSNPADNDSALLTLLAQWAGASNRGSLAAITHDGEDDDLFGGSGDDDFSWETLDHFDDPPALAPADYNAFGMGTDERFGPTS